MENEELIKNLLPQELIVENYKQELAKKAEIEARQKAIEDKYKQQFVFEVDGKELNIQLKQIVTPETRHKLRMIAKDAPVHKIAALMQQIGLEKPNLTDDEKYIELINQGITKQEIINLMQGIPDNDYQTNAEIFVMTYFQAIISNTGESKVLIETPVVTDGKIYGIWKTVDYDTALEAVGFFRKKTGI